LLVHFYGYSLEGIGELTFDEFFNLRNDIVDVYEFFHPNEQKSGHQDLSPKEFEVKARKVQAEMERRKKERG